MDLIEGHRPIKPPAGVPELDADPYADETLANPAAFYAQLRACGPFAYIPKYSMLACGRYAETSEVFSDWERFTSARGVGLQDFALEEPWRPPSKVLEVDPPFHTRTRRVLTRAMSPKAVADMKEMFRVEADRLVTALLEREAFDGVTDFAEAYPTTVFPKAVGLKQADPRKLIDYGAMVFNALGPDNAIRAAAMAKGPEIVPWIYQQCLRNNLEPEGFGATIYAAADSGDIDEEEAGMLVRSLLSAGVDTTVTALGNALWCLAINPDQFEALKADPSLARAAFEETMRFTSPVAAFCRTASADTEVSGIHLQEGTKILCCLGSANLDETHWPDADRFDISRRTIGHLALGVGVHACVGQNVARAEGEALLGAVARQVDRIELTGPAVWRPNNAIHALDQLPVRFVGR